LVETIDLPGVSHEFSWTCAACGRQVPRRVSTCRCGESRSEPAAPIASVEQTVEAPPQSGALKSGLTLLGLAALASIAVVFVRPAPEPSSRPIRETARVATAPAAATPPAAPPPTRPADVPWVAPPPQAAVTPGSIGPSSGPRAIEDVVASATPAVVLVETPGGRGTGFFIAADRIVTNAHVVQQAGYVTTVNAAGARVSARVAMVAPAQDLALLVPADVAQGQAVLPLAAIADVRVGEEVLAIGSPLGFQNTVTRGIVSALRRSGDVMLVQTDAAINPGNSGGPLLDRTGRVIAVTTMKVSGSAESLGFGVAADHVRALVAGGATGGTSSLTSAMMPHPSGGDADDASDLRSSGETQYDRAMAQVGRRADALDADWERFVESCLPHAPRTTGDRPFFAVWDRSFSESAIAPSCSSYYRRFRVAADEFRTAMSMTDDMARRAGVYPGTRREIRERYRLSWDGWDR
jgi:S1-C subfamily serine protease